MTASQIAGRWKLEIGANIAQSDAGSLFQFAALISINLAIINIFASTRWWSITFFINWRIARKPLPTQDSRRCYANRTNGTVRFRIFLIVRDTANLAWVQNLFQWASKWSLKAAGTGDFNSYKQLYPVAPCTLNYETPVQLLVATILSSSVYWWAGRNQNL